MTFSAQLGGQGDLISTIVWFVLFFVMIFLYPKLMISQTIWQLEKSAAELEALDARAQSIALRRISKNPSKQQRGSMKRFMEFFAVGPVDLDPAGIIRKIDLVSRRADYKFRYFVSQMMPRAPAEEQSNIKNAIAGAMTAHQIAKIVRHFLETVKKYKIFQLAMILQMQIPLIARIAKAALGATSAFADGVPVGDGIGPMVASTIIGKSKTKFYSEDEFVVCEKKVAGKKVFVSKAWGPGASTGFPGRFLKKFTAKNRITRIITVDAALKMEGETPGSVAEGVGVAMGGSGVDRYEIEEFAVRNNIPLDAIAIKMSDEEAIMPMRKEIYQSIGDAVELVDEVVKRGPKNEKILLIGVGNTCGVGNDEDSFEKSVKVAIERATHAEAERKKEEKGGFLSNFGM
ncbi:MAG TPA: DUF1512 domain-containing protein [archaeon]|nr:DUF1512 domain-containing protein [archaeon]